ncbi:uncharacterized protein LOC34619029 [Cyclospora cayetanensis]|uniref:Uncharacterized protein LOC34619029 n=1 Tax=Cyclospora cayetanensis TaxID=88456 RepID=A0A6P6S0I9_9EIME|nr:uncharacterized protein LOC34619029 [Cyclospora cayetanensis]
MKDFPQHSEYSILDVTERESKEGACGYFASSLEVRSCGGFSATSIQAAALVPFSSRAALRHDSLKDQLLVFCLGSWCIVRTITPDAAETDGGADCLNANDCTHSHIGENSDPSATNNRSTLSKEGSASVKSLAFSKLPSPYTERIFTRHTGKVNLLVYCDALSLCLSAEQQNSSKEPGSLHICRLWSPHTLKEVALVQVPSRHDITSAHFSHDGNVLLLLLADPLHSFVVYVHIAPTIQGHFCDDTRGEASSDLPVLHAAQVIPCSRSLLNGLTLEPANYTFGPSKYRQSRRSQCLFDTASFSSRVFPWRNNALSQSSCRSFSGSNSVLRFATFGQGHLRIWSFNCGRPDQPPSYRSLCIARVGGHSGQKGQPEATACAFLASGDLITALADRRIVLFRGMVPLRSVSLPSCCSRILLLKPLQRSLLLLVAQEGLIQLLPLAALTSNQALGRALPRHNSSPIKEAQARGLNTSRRPVAPTAVSALSHAYRRQPAQLRPESEPCSTTPRKGSRRWSSTSRYGRAAPPFATGSLHAPSRTPRSTYGDSVGRWSTNSARQSRLRPNSAAIRRGTACRTAKLSAERSPSAVSRVSTRSSVSSSFQPQERRQQKPQVGQTRTKKASSAVLSLRVLHPKRYLTTQQVATRHLGKGEASTGEEVWLPLHSSQVVSIYWKEPLLLLCTRTQMMIVDALHLSDEATVILQERPLGRLDVAAFLHRSSSGASAAAPPIPPANNTQEAIPCVVISGGRCCIGGELRLWELGLRNRPTLPLYFKAPVTAVAAAATKGEVGGVAVVGTEEGRVVVLALQWKNAGVLQQPTVVLDRQIVQRPISALGIDATSRVMAMASTAGHVTCFRLSIPLDKANGIPASRYLARAFMGSGTGFKEAATQSKAALCMMELEPLTTLNLPSSTLPRLLEFGHSSVYKGHLLVVGSNATPSVFSIPDGCLLDASVLDSFTPLAIPVPIAIGVESTLHSVDDTLGKVLGRMSIRSSVSTVSGYSTLYTALPAPLLLRACQGSSRLCFTYEPKQHRIFGIRARCLWARKREASQQLSQGSTGLARYENYRFGPSTLTCTVSNSKQKHPQASRFLRGPGLASLFRDLRQSAEPTATSDSLSNVENHNHHGNGWVGGISCAASIADTSEAEVISFTSLMLPHVSAPTVLFGYTAARQPFTATFLGNVQAPETSMGLISVAAEGYVLEWEYRAIQQQQQLFQNSTGGIEPNVVSFQRNDHLHKDNQSAWSSPNEPDASKPKVVSPSDLIQQGDTTSVGIRGRQVTQVDCDAWPSTFTTVGRNTPSNIIAKADAMHGTACPLGVNTSTDRDTRQERAYDHTSQGTKPVRILAVANCNALTVSLDLLGHSRVSRGKRPSPLMLTITSLSVK